MNRRGAVAIGEILIMVVGIIAVAWIIGCGIGEVTGVEIVSKYDGKTYDVSRNYMAEMKGGRVVRVLMDSEMYHVLRNEYTMGTGGGWYRMSSEMGGERNAVVQRVMDSVGDDGSKIGGSYLFGSATTTTAPTPTTILNPATSTISPKEIEREISWRNVGETSQGYHFIDTNKKLNPSEVREYQRYVAWYNREYNGGLDAPYDEAKALERYNHQKIDPDKTSFEDLVEEYDRLHEDTPSNLEASTNRMQSHPHGITAQSTYPTSESNNFPYSDNPKEESSYPGGISRVMSPSQLPRPSTGQGTTSGGDGTGAQNQGGNQGGDTKTPSPDPKKEQPALETKKPYYDPDARVLPHSAYGSSETLTAKVGAEDVTVYKGNGDKITLKSGTEIKFDSKKTHAIVDGEEVEIKLPYSKDLVKEGILTSGKELFWEDANGYHSIVNGQLKEHKNYADYAEAKSVAETGKKPGFGKDGGWFGKGTLSGAIASAAGWAMTAYAVSSLITGFLSGDAKAYGEALSPALSSGIFAGKLAYEVFGEKGIWENKWMAERGGAGPWSIGLGFVVAAAVFIWLYKEEETETITFTCTPWDAPSGGNNCEKCNNNKDLPCSEYQCRSLGQSCQLQNANTDTPLCTWVNRKDVEGPKITLWEEMLTPGLKFTPTKVSSPNDRGTKIVSEKTGDCIPAYTPLVIGIQTDEPARCKIDTLSMRNMTDMRYYFGSSLFLYNHTFTMSVPGQTLDEATQTIELKNNGVAELYVKCADSNGNENVGSFVFKFCVDASEDTTAPQILGTNIINGMPIAFNTTKLDIELYTNEPADCRWDYLDKGQYEEMKGTMSCNRKANEINAQMVYTCSATLDGLKSGIGSENNFYFKCRDKPTAKSGRNTNAENYKLTLYGTQQLKLERAGPNGTTIKGNTEPIEVELTARTAAGYQDGAATCYYRLPDGEYVQFFETGGATHSQKLFFETGYYEVPIKCVDAGGNSDEEIIKFNVESDLYPPQVLRIFKDEGRLRMITDEDAECVYDTLGCNYQFNDGIAMTAVEGTNQYTDWAPEQTYYIKCRDRYLNQPDAGTCTLQIKMYDKI